MSTLREDFEAWYRDQMVDDPNGPAALCEWLAYKAATERAAKVVEQAGPKEGSLKLMTEGFAAAIRGTGSGAS